VDRQYGTGRFLDNFFRNRTEHEATPSSPAVGGDDNQIDGKILSPDSNRLGLVSVGRDKKKLPYPSPKPPGETETHAKWHEVAFVIPSGMG